MFPRKGLHVSIFLGNRIVTHHNKTVSGDWGGFIFGPSDLFLVADQDFVFFSMPVVKAVALAIAVILVHQKNLSLNARCFFFAFFRIFWNSGSSRAESRNESVFIKG